ncbi:MAG: response regulator [Desulfobacteraceae bacterium]|nr:response regulator [Desulfobacteraceae bacterium]
MKKLKPNLNLKITPFKIALIYIVLSSLWIVLSDALLSIISDNPLYLTRLQSFKGIFFITISAALVFYLTNKSVAQVKASKLALFESQEKYKKIFNAPTEAIFIHDAKTGEIIDLNNAAIKMFGYDLKEEMISIKVGCLSGNDIEISQPEALKKISLAAKKIPQQFEWFSQKKDGTTFFSEVSLKYADIAGKDCVVAIVRDITERKLDLEEKEKLAEQLHQSQKMEAIGQLAGGVAHDFNNMLNAIGGAAELIKLKKDNPEIIDKYTDLIIKSADKAGYLTKQLLTFARKTKKSTKKIDVAEVLKESVSLLKHTINKSVTIEVIKNASNTIISGDDHLIQSCFINLGINAEHAMPDGGSLTFKLKNVYLDQNYCDESNFNINSGKYLLISVEDSGHGIPKEIINNIFEPFFTTKEQGKGTGLGLSAVFGTVCEHGGAITVYSEPGKGSVFNIYLPVSEKLNISQKNISSPIKGSGTILFIDDEETIRKVGQLQMETLGYKVITAENGKAGIEVFKENKDIIDIIILDMIMPVMGGNETASKLREIDPYVPILISSGFSRDKNLDEIKKNTISGFLNKPFLLNELSVKISKALKDK